MLKHTHHHHHVIKTLVPLPVLIRFIKALLVVGWFQKVTLDDPNDPDTFVVGLQQGDVSET